MLPIVIKILLVIHVFVSLLIILLTLMQRPKNEGLGAAFGGGMTDNLFGAQTTNVLQTITRWLGGIFFGLTLLLSCLYVRLPNVKSASQKELTEKPAVVVPAATPAPAPALPAAATEPVVAPTPEAAPALPVPATPAATPAEPAPAPAAPAPPANQ